MSARSVSAAFGWLSACLLSLSGCGGGGGGDVATTGATSAPASLCSSAADCGEVYVALTDADGDFLSYTVDVVSLTLRRADGSTVEALPTSTRVDFAQYVDLTELVTAATIPNGTYVEGTLRLDYGNAEITVESAAQPVAATAVDDSGAALGIVDVRVVLDNRNRLVVTTGRPALLTLDFDLAASHTVDLTATPVTVTARPVLIASLEPVEEKELRLRGPLVSVDTSAGSYVIDVRPFHHRNARLGRVTVHTDAATSFEVNGQMFVGAAGLDALSQAGAGTATVAFGTLSTSERRFDAENVHAGTSVPGAGIDAVLGSVLARTGDTLTVRGGTLIRDTEGDARFVRGDIEVNLGPDTLVFKDGDRSSVGLAIDAISVGQRIHAFGEVQQAGDDWQLDATNGRVRMHVTHLFGTVGLSVPGALTLALDAIDGRRVDAFDFSGTGATASLDADPDQYEVNTGVLTDLGIFAGESVRIFGFVTPFGAAPPDFEGSTVVDFAGLRATLAIGWGDEGTTAPFVTAGSTGITLDLANQDIGARHHIRIGARLIDLLSLPVSPQIAPASGRTAYVISKDGASRTFHDFGEFVTELNLQFDGATALEGVIAHGQYDAGSAVLTARTVVAVFE